MAYVAISGEFMDRVKGKIASMRNAEINTLGKYEEQFSPESDLFLTTVWKDHLPLRKVIPKEWKNECENFNVRFKIGDKQVNHSFHLTGKGDTPPKHSYYDSMNVDATHPEMAKCVDYYTRRLEIDARWDEVHNKVTEFLQSCKSLNEAVKLWPDVAMYIQPQDMERMGVKRERAKESAAMEALKKLDTDALVGAAVIARMSGAQV